MAGMSLSGQLVLKVMASGDAGQVAAFKPLIEQQIRSFQYPRGRGDLPAIYRYEVLDDLAVEATKMIVNRDDSQYGISGLINETRRDMPPAVWEYLYEEFGRRRSFVSDALTLKPDNMPCRIPDTVIKKLASRARSSTHRIAVHSMPSASPGSRWAAVKAGSFMTGSVTHIASQAGLDMPSGRFSDERGAKLLDVAVAAMLFDNDGPVYVHRQSVEELLVAATSVMPLSEETLDRLLLTVACGPGPDRPAWPIETWVKARTLTHVVRALGSRSDLSQQDVIHVVAVLQDGDTCADDTHVAAFLGAVRERLLASAASELLDRFAMTAGLCAPVAALPDGWKLLLDRADGDLSRIPVDALNRLAKNPDVDVATQVALIELEVPVETSAALNRMSSEQLGQLGSSNPNALLLLASSSMAVHEFYNMSWTAQPWAQKWVTPERLLAVAEWVHGLGDEASRMQKVQALKMVRHGCDHYPGWVAEFINYLAASDGMPGSVEQHMLAAISNFSADQTAVFASFAADWDGSLGDLLNVVAVV